MPKELPPDSIKVTIRREPPELVLPKIQADIKWVNRQVVLTFDEDSFGKLVSRAGNDLENVEAINITLKKQNSSKT